MFERFTEKAIKAIMIAQEESRRLGHNFVGTEQILLGLIGEGTGVAAKALASMGVKLKETRIEVEKIIGRGSGIVAVEIPFTPRTKRVLELSVQEANQEGVNYVGTEHLLLGLIQERKGVGVQVLKNLGVDLLKVQTQVMRMLNKDTKDQTYTVLGRPILTLNPETKTITVYVSILVFDDGSGDTGIYSIRIGKRNKILMFESGISAEYFSSMLARQGFPKATVELVDKREIQNFCIDSNYDFEVVPADSVIIPPELNVETTDWEKSRQINEQLVQIFNPKEQNSPDKNYAVVKKAALTFDPETQAYYLTTLRETYVIYKKNLADLKLELARRGYSVEINRQIEYYTQEINKIEKEVHGLS